MNRVFLLSPANCNGLRGRRLLERNSRSALASRLRKAGVPLGEVFSFLSALYFRGKLAYAQAFAHPPPDCPGILIITPTAGLTPHDTLIRLPKLRGFGRVPIHVDNRIYYSSLRRSAKQLGADIGTDCELVLLGSLATGKYLDILAPIFGNRLRVPAEFIGRGNMSRGGLMLRCVRENRELHYMEAATICASLPKRRRAERQISDQATIQENPLLNRPVLALQPTRIPLAK
jgi:hypothetical protein